MTTYTAIIVDDDETSLLILNDLLKTFTENIIVLGVAKNLDEAYKLYTKYRPQILFLDIYLGNNETTFTLINKFNITKSEIIFITNNKKFALQAINVNPIAFLIKPLKAETFLQVIVKVTNVIDSKLQHAKNGSLNQLNIIGIPNHNRIDLINVEDIIYIKADGRYSEFYIKNDKFIVATRNLGDFEKILDQKLFFRIHNRYIVPITSIIEINKNKGTFSCEIINGITLPIAKRRVKLLYHFLGMR